MASIARAFVASGAFAQDTKNVPTPATLHINIPVTARVILATSPPASPPMLSTSASSASSFESLPELGSYRPAFPIRAPVKTPAKALANLNKVPIKSAPVAAVKAPTTSSAATVVEPEKARRLSQEFFFPGQTRFECVVPEVISAKSVHLKDHPMVEGQFSQYDNLYNDDSLMTVDGRFM
ncbi:hypothetical protein BG004_001218, partial [Podila humilis]